MTQTPSEVPEGYQLQILALQDQVSPPGALAFLVVDDAPTVHFQADLSNCTRSCFR